MGKETLLSVRGVTKSFGVTKVLNDVSFDVERGEVRGFIGENGSGKSTLSNIIAGIYTKDEGTILLDGKELNAKSVIESRSAGVSLIVQEIGTIANISVAANIFLGNESDFRSHGMIDFKRMNTEAASALAEIGVNDISPEAISGSLSLEDRKIVEIAKAYRSHPSLLIVDETSNALSERGREILYGVIKKVRQDGGSVLFITHDLDELVVVCDSVTILRDGTYVGTFSGDEMDIPSLKTKMVGREMSEHFYREDWDGSSSDKVVLKVDDVFTSFLKNVSLELHEGEILGLGGLSNCGMHELGRLLFALDAPYKGTITVFDHEMKNPVDAMSLGVGYLSRNRDTEALILQMSVKDNICLGSLGKLGRMGFSSQKEDSKFASTWINELNIKLRDPSQYVAELSGGNKQKVVIAKWLGCGSRILIMDCPTRGIDIGVKEAIYHLMEQLKQEGHSILLISEELPELIGMSDRILIMRDGQIVHESMRSPSVTEKMLIQDMI